MMKRKEKVEIIKKNRVISSANFIVLGMIFVLILYLFIFQTKYASQTLTWAGEKTFLTFHLNNTSIKLLDYSRKLDENNFYTYYMLGRLHFMERNSLDSIKNYTQAIGLNEEFKEAYYGRALVYGFSGKFFLSDAQIDFQKYIELDKEEFKKNGVHAYGAWAAYNDLAWIHFLKGDFIKMEIAALQGINTFGQNPWLENMLGTSLLARDKCDQAIVHLKIALQMANEMTVEDFGEAYTGDPEVFWPNGLEQMKTTVKENIKLCEEKMSNTE